ncbi:hypothetical protein [Undibacterium sp. TJN19]|uniref:hypothetical protein n=1 Tax=Undibacterium sp. TJN19 TaxID=3413055 RepID=UPI003BF128B9
MKKLCLLLALIFPITCLAQTAVFRCEVDGKVVWSDQPCKSKGKAVVVKRLQSGRINASNRYGDADDRTAATPSNSVKSSSTPEPAKPAPGK